MLNEAYTINTIVSTEILNEAIQVQYRNLKEAIQIIQHKIQESINNIEYLKHYACIFYIE